VAQFLRPDSNVTQTSFTNGFAEIDESTASDADFAFGANNTAAVLEVGLGNPSGTPGSGTTTVRYRVAKTNAGVLDGGGNAVTVTVGVYQGTTLIAADTPRTANGTWAGYSYTPDMSGVTDWSDLRLRFTTSASGGSPAARRGGAVSWAEIEAPDAPAGITGTMAATETGSDTLSGSGGVVVAGTLAAQEIGDDAFAGSGTVTDPPTDITGSMAAQEAGDDTLVASGNVEVAGSLVAGETGAGGVRSGGRCHQCRRHGRYLGLACRRRGRFRRLLCVQRSACGSLPAAIPHHEERDRPVIQPPSSRA
jgi:hypothetical protein